MRFLVEQDVYNVTDLWLKQQGHDGSTVEVGMQTYLYANDRLAEYRQTARRRGEVEECRRAWRMQCAWEVARQAAALLKEEFHAADVMVFGSLVHGLWFSKTSDVDLAAWGLKEADYFIAVAKLQDLSPDFNVDLVAIEHCNPALREVVSKEGIRL